MSRSSVLWGAAALGVLLAGWLSPRAIPYNMDEFVHYHALGCATAADTRALPKVRDGCGYFDLRLPFTRTPLPLRAYSYIGSLPALPFYPFWKLIGDPVAVRVAGAACFLLCTFLAGRLLRVGPGPIVTASLVFPLWPVTFLVDEGPVGLSVALLLLALLAARRAIAEPGDRASAAWAASAGFAIFLGLWTKLVFAWWLPVVAVFALEEAHRQGLSPAAAVRRRLPALLVGALLLIAPLATLLASVDSEGRPYAATLRQGGFTAEADDVEAVAVRLAAYVTDGSLVAPRNVLLPPSPLDFLPLLSSLALLALGARRGPRRREILAWTALALVTFGFVAASAHSRWPHHFAFPLLPLVLALALALDALGVRERLAAAALVAVFWGSLAARLPASRVPEESSPDKDRLLAFVRERGLDRATLQVHSSWGTYYIGQLFGDPARLVVYARRAMDDPERLRQMAALSRETGRPLLLLSSRRWDRLHTPAVASALGEPQHSWQFGSWWAVEYHPPRE